MLFINKINNKQILNKKVSFSTTSSLYMDNSNTVVASPEQINTMLENVQALQQVLIEIHNTERKELELTKFNNVLASIKNKGVDSNAL